MSLTTENPRVPDRPVGNAHVPDIAPPGMWPTDDWLDEVNVARLSADDQIEVTTRNTRYEIVVTTPRTGDVLVRGGRYFPEFTAVHLLGSSLDGSSLKMRSVNVGARLEFAAGGRPVITTSVRAVRVLPVAASDGCW